MQQPTIIHSPTYYKQATDGLIAHVYEHVAATHIDTYMRQHDQLLLVDYDSWGKTYGTSCFIETRFHTEESAHVFHEALENLTKTTFNAETVLHAAQSCACEYERPLTHIDEGLTITMNELNSMPWKTAQEFTFEQAQDTSSVNTTFKDKNIQYDEHAPESFEELIIEYGIPERVFAGQPALKALGVVVVQALALNIIRIATDITPSYDTGDEWNEGAQNVMYRHYQRYNTESLPTIASAKKSHNESVQALIKKGIASKITRVIQENYANESLRYFDTQTLNNITGGIIMGGQGWKDVATKENVELLLNSVQTAITQAS